MTLFQYWLCFKFALKVTMYSMSVSDRKFCSLFLSVNMPIIKLSSEPTISFTVDTYKLLAGTLPEHNTLHWFSEYVYWLEMADGPVSAQVVQQLEVRVTESTRLDGWAHNVLHYIEVSE